MDEYPVLDEQGRLGVGAHPWAEMMAAVVRMVVGHPEYEWMGERMAGRLRRMWEDEELMEAFLAIDVQFLRAAESTQRVPPPGTEAAQPSSNANSGEDEQKYRCMIPDCEACFSTL